MQNINIPAEDKDIEAVVSNVILSRFPEVHFLLESFYKCLVNYALLCNDVMIDEFIGDLWTLCCFSAFHTSMFYVYEVSKLS